MRKLKINPTYGYETNYPEQYPYKIAFSDLLEIIMSDDFSEFCFDQNLFEQKKKTITMINMVPCELIQKAISVNNRIESVKAYINPHTTGDNYLDYKTIIDMSNNSKYDNLEIYLASSFFEDMDLFDINSTVEFGRINTMDENIPIINFQIQKRKE